MAKLHEKYPTFIPSAIAIVMLLLSIPKMLPYGYYTLLRWVVCGACIFIANIAHNAKAIVFTYIAGIIAILFNPLIPVHLKKETWAIIDFITVGILFVSIWFVKDKTK